MADGRAHRVNVEVNVKGTPRHEIQRRGDKLVVSVFKAALAQTAGSSAQPKKKLAGYSYQSVEVAGVRTRGRRSQGKRRRYSGRRIDLDFKTGQIFDQRRLR